MPKIAIITADANHNLSALLEAHQEKNLKDGEISLVISSAKNAVKAAQQAGIETLPLPNGGAYDNDLAAAVGKHKPDLIVALDSPHNFAPEFLAKFPRKVIAAHPALAGHFMSGSAVEQAYEAFQKNEIKWSGCSVHYVGPNGAAAEVMRQLVVAIEPKEPIDRFEARMRQGEKWLLLKAVKQYLYELRTRSKKNPRSAKS
jgi:phosphoribosylglycinamide formyltransferase-1